MPNDRKRDSSSDGVSAFGESLRRMAEEYFESHPERRELADPKDAEAALHELRVHQIELEMQNDELRRTEGELESARAKYFDLYDFAPVGYVTIDSAGRVSEANLTAAALLHVDRDAVVGAPFSRFVLPEDGDAYYLHMKRLRETADPTDFEFRLRRGDGAIWVSAQARVDALCGVGESTCRVTFVDVNELKRAREDQQQASERFRAVVNASHDLIYMSDRNGVIEFMSSRAGELFGREPSQFVGQLFTSLVHPDDAGQCDEALARVVQGDGTEARIEYRIQYYRGDWRWFEASVAPVHDISGEVVQYVGNARDVTQRRSDEAQMRRLAMTDELTGIGNRRLLTSVAAEEFKRARRYDYGLSILMIDIDNLKAINDSFDHGVGDRVLQAVAGVCQAICRETDEVGRLGGDEFALLLPHSDVQAALEVGDRLRQAVESADAGMGLPQDFRVTVSVGIGLMKPDDAEFTTVLRRADRALHQAKERGRNLTCA